MQDRFFTNGHPELILEWNNARATDWRHIRRLFVDAYMSAYANCSLKELGFDKGLSKSEAEMSDGEKQKIKAEHFASAYQSEKKKIDDQGYPRRIHYLVARYYDHPAAFFVMEMNYKTGHVYLRWVTVARAFQGKGLGEKMLDEVARHFPEASGLELYTSISNKGSQKFYKRYGFDYAGKLNFSEPEPRSLGLASFIRDVITGRELFLPADDRTDTPELCTGLTKSLRMRV